MRDIEGRATAGTPLTDVHAASGGAGERCPPESMEGMRSGGLKPAGQFRALGGGLGDCIQAVAKGRPPRVAKLTMADVVGFFVAHRSSAAAAEAAAIVRDQANPGPQPHPDGTGHLVHLFFLDKEGRPLLGAHGPARTYLAQQFDDELAAAFGSNNVVIFS